MVRALHFCFIAIILTVGCSVERQTSPVSNAAFDIMDTIVLSPKHPNISIENNTDAPVHFNMKLNERFPMSIDEMVKEIEVNALLDSCSKTISAWKFVSDYTYHLVPFSSDPWIHDPSILLNSLAGGFCDDRSSLLAYLWNESGFVGHVKNLNGHVVAEVNDEKKWQLFDPDHGVYYTDSTGEIVGLNYLEKNACNGLSTVGSNIVQRIFWDCKTNDSQRSMKSYTSVNDNIDATAWHLDFKPLKNLEFVLPSGAVIILVKGNKHHSDVVVVKLTIKSLGLMRIPLVPYAVKGAAVFKMGGNTVTSRSNTVLNLPKNRMHDSVIVENVIREAFVYYHINPKLSSLKDSNILSISAANGQLNAESSEGIPIVYDEQRSAAMDFDRHITRHLEYLRSMPSSFKRITIAEIKKEYQAFLSLDPSVDSAQSQKLLKNFANDLKMLEDTLRLTEVQWLEFAEQYYPKSLLWMFITMRHSHYRYLHKLRFANKEEQLSICL